MSQQHLLKHKNLEFTVFGTKTLPSKVTLCISDSKCRYGKRLHRVEIVSEYHGVFFKVRRLGGWMVIKLPSALLKISK